MTSQKQRAANKRNAQNSSGPTSDAGKAASRMNALKSGLYAKSAVIRGESQEEFDEIVRQYNEQFHPVTPQARVLVDSLIRNTWLLRRYATVEGELWQSRFYKVDDFRHTDTRMPTALAFEMLPSDYDRLRKYVDAAERAIIRALNKLDKLTEHFPEPVESEPASAENGFVPADVAQALPVCGSVPDVPAASTLGSTQVEAPDGSKLTSESPHRPEKEAA